MRELGLRVENGDAVAAHLKSLSSPISRRLMREALPEGGVLIQERAEQLAPRAPGQPDLADHIVMAPARNPDGPGAALAIGPSTERRSDQPRTTFGRQGAMVELGTARMSPQPFLRPAFDEQHRPALTAIGQALWRELAARGLQRPMQQRTGPMTGGPGGGLL